MITLRALYLLSLVPFVYSYLKHPYDAFIISLFVLVPATIVFLTLVHRAYSGQKRDGTNSKLHSIKTAITGFTIVTMFFWIGTEVGGGSGMGGAIAEALSEVIAGCGFVVIAIHLVALQYFRSNKGQINMSLKFCFLVALCVVLAIYTKESIGLLIGWLV
jgi:heme/copper-type cytochrome/quinol oxidase subunit 4